MSRTPEVNVNLLILAYCGQHLVAMAMSIRLLRSKISFWIGWPQKPSVI